MDDYQSVFNCILRLFLGHGAEAVKELEEIYESHNDEVEFYIPQLVVFLLYGAFETAGCLHDSVLYMSRKSSLFAHRLHWFVVAFSLSGAGVTAEGVVALQRLLSEVEESGEADSKAIAQGHGKYESQTNEVGEGEPESSSHSDDALGAHLTSGDRMVSQESSHHNQRYPLARTTTPPNCNSFFQPTTLFWEKMIEISRRLCVVPRPARTDELRKSLSQCMRQYLPSANIYAPLGNEHHR